VVFNMMSYPPLCWVHSLQGQLVEERKKRADLAMQSASWRNQEALEARVKQLEKEKADLLVCKGGGGWYTGTV
jgi:hypothetical protein